VSVRVKVPTIFRNLVGGEAVVEANGGRTVGEMLDELDRRFPGLKDRLVTGDGDLHRFVNVYVNEEDVRYLGALRAEVREGDTVSILPAVAGGSAD